MRRVVSFVVWWALLVCLWALYVGTTTRLEILWGIGAAAVGAVAIEVVRSQNLLLFRTDRSWLARAWSVPHQIVLDFGLLTWEVLRAVGAPTADSRHVRRVAFETGADHPVDRWRRAWATTLGTMSPNGIVAEMNRERGTALMHSLRADKSSGQKAL